MNTLTDLKSYLATPNATLAMARYEWRVNDEWREAAPRNPNPRKVAKLQTNAVAFFDLTGSGVSWLYFGKASEWAFTDNIAINTTDNYRITYRMEAN